MTVKVYEAVAVRIRAALVGFESLSNFALLRHIWT